jgi:hypothetical protein
VLIGLRTETDFFNTIFTFWPSSLFVSFFAGKETSSNHDFAHGGSALGEISTRSSSSSSASFNASRNAKIGVFNVFPDEPHLRHPDFMVDPVLRVLLLLGMETTRLFSFNSYCKVLP